MSDPAARRRELILRGPILGALVRLGWPVVITNQLVVLIMLISSFWMGRMVGTTGLSITAIMTPVELLVLWILGTVSYGQGALVSQSVGANDGRGMNLVASSLALQALVSTALALVGLALLTPLAELLAGQPELVPDLKTYLVPFLISIPAFGFGDVLLQTATASGWTKFGLIRIIASLGFVVTVTPLLMKFMHLGVASAPATALIGAAALDLSMWMAIQRRRVALGLGHRDRTARLVDKKVWGRLIGIGAPVQFGRVATFLAQVILIRHVSQETAAEGAAFGLCFQVLYVPLMFTQALGIVNGIIVGQNAGARQPARIVSSIKHVVTIVSVVSVLLFFAAPFARPLLALFSSDDAVVDSAARALLVMRWGAIATPITQVLVGSYTALGKTRFAGSALIVSQVVAVIVALTYSGSHLNGAVWGYTVSQCLPLALLAATWSWSFGRIRAGLERVADPPKVH
ncbi:MAG: putative efflux protein family [Myxococcales bacterium]|nr:putative efflux protein family [Myxococcales bacterium]